MCSGTEYRPMPSTMVVSIFKPLAPHRSCNGGLYDAFHREYYTLKIALECGWNEQAESRMLQCEFVVAAMVQDGFTVPVHAEKLNVSLAQAAVNPAPGAV